MNFNGHFYASLVFKIFGLVHQFFIFKIYITVQKGEIHSFISISNLIFTFLFLSTPVNFR